MRNWIFNYFFSAFHKNFDILFHSWKDLEANNTCHLVFFFSGKLNLAFIFSVTFLAFQFSLFSEIFPSLLKPIKVLPSTSVRPSFYFQCFTT